MAIFLTEEVIIIMNVLVACEFSGVVRDAFIEKGHNAWSCDLLAGEGKYKQYHNRYDVLYCINNSFAWDLMIAFPPCTHLAVSGARWFKNKKYEQRCAINFFLKLVNAPIPKIAIENPVGIMNTWYRKPDQIIQPFQFGHPESKRTCLWLKNLPRLVPTNVLPLPKQGYWNNQTPSGQNKLGPSEKRAQIRGITYKGIAEAMAEEWG